jgi:methylenetetrahydrofolate dehydrogenase (NADP+)/methenyltetrahydrofolate cyclohydrolase
MCRAPEHQSASAPEDKFHKGAGLPHKVKEDRGEMSAKLLDGEALAKKIRDDLKNQIAELKSKQIIPHLVAVQIGENPASKMYVWQQQKSCEEMGMLYTLNQLPETSTQDDMLREIEKLNNDKNVTGIILQMPLPQGVDARKVQISIDPGKDAEGLHPVNVGRLVSATNIIAPCTALGALELLKSTGISLKGLEIVVVGHSEIVGKPISMLLLQSITESPTVTVCHVATKDLAHHTKNADIIFSATGKSQAVWLKYSSALKKYSQDKSLPKPQIPNLSPLIKADMIKDGSIIIDIAINRIPEGFDNNGNPLLNEKGKPKMKTVGDVEFDKAKEKAAWITPVPGGVGPMTVASLLKNIVILAQDQIVGSR